MPPLRRGAPDVEVQKLPARTMACRVLGHSWIFTVDGGDMLWRCNRGCGVGGRREYGDPAEARFFASRLNSKPPGPPRIFLKAMAGIVSRRGDAERETGER